MNCTFLRQGRRNCRKVRATIIKAAGEDGSVAREVPTLCSVRKGGNFTQGGRCSLGNGVIDLSSQQEVSD